MADAHAAIVIADQLQDWIEDRDGLSLMPVVSVTYTPSTLEISIGHIVVWSSEVDAEEDMTVKYCRDRWLEEIESLRPFMAEAAKAKGGE